MSVKGSWNRVTDHKAFNDNWDKIFGDKKDDNKETISDTSTKDTSGGEGEREAAVPE